MGSKKFMLPWLALILLGLVTACAQTSTVETAVVEQDGEDTAGAPEVQAETVAETTVVEEKAEAAAVDSQTEQIRLDLHIRGEPPSLDPATVVDTTSIFFVGQMFTGLTAFDEAANVVPALATEWKVSANGLEWTFFLRDDVRWVQRDPASGEVEDIGPVTAQDVVYGVTRTLDPRTASSYAYVMYVIEGAEALNSADPDSDNFDMLLNGLGVSAPDDTTMVFRLQQPAAYFPSIAGMWVAYPQPQQAIEQWDDQWTEAGNIVTNGPYTLSEWNHGTSLELVKNPHWVNADDVQIDLVGGPVIQEASTAMALYENNELDMMADPPGWDIPLPDMNRVRTDPQLSQELLIAPRLCTYFFGYVHTKPPFDDPLVRKAFAAAIDRNSLIENVTKAGEVPAHSFASPGIFGNVADDMDIGAYLVKPEYTVQVAQAQAWLAEAGFPNGAGIDIILAHDTSEAHAQVAQAVQSMWQEAFPEAKITIENQEWATYLETLMPDSPDEDKPHVYRLAWCADYPDQNNWVNEVFNSQSGLNFSKYSNPKFDALVEDAAVEANPDTRIKLYRQAEDILVNQDAVIAPVYYQTFNRLYKPWLTKVVISPVGADPVAQWRMDWEAKQAARSE